MSVNSATSITVLHMRFKLQVPPDVFLAKCREAASFIASAEGLVWKIWILQQEKLEIGGIYLFANRENAEAYLNHPVTQAVGSNPAVVSTQSELWDVENSLSVLTRAPLKDFRAQNSEPVSPQGKCWSEHEGQECAAPMTGGL